MARSMFSPNWFRVADLRPRLRSHARIHRQRFRGGTWFVVQDEQSGRYHRLSPEANHMVAMMDGRRTMGQIWAATTEWIGPEAEPPTQDEAIRLLAQLHQADLLAGDLPPDIDELAHRADTREWRAFVQKLKNPLALRLPLIDPDRFLEATMPLVRPLFSWLGVVLWLSIVIAGATIAVVNWGELTEGIADRVLLQENILLLLLVYPVVKALHELGHGYAVKNWGGRVHEMGLMFLVLIPVPYVDASSASAFRSKWQRAVVGGAGIIVELFIAGIAMIVWVTAEPGLVRAAAFNAALIGGVSTLLFNGNPLLRFDGYYVMADLLEIPNLGQRANKHFIYVLKRYGFGMIQEQSPATAPGERAWFMFYSISAFVYRLFIMITIALFVAGQLFFVGIALAIYAVFNALVWPLLKGLWWLAEAPELRSRRRRAVTVSVLGAGVIAGALLAIPLPYATSAQGVVWVPEDAVIRAETEGFVVRLGTGQVTEGDRLFELEDPVLDARRNLIALQRAEIRMRLGQQTVQDRVREAILREQLAQADAAIARIDERLAGLSQAAPRAGVLLTSRTQDMPGSFVERGDLIGYLVAPGDPLIRVAVPEASADLVQRRLQGVEVQLVDAIGQPMVAEVIRIVPQVSRDLPSPTLGSDGGGSIALDPTASNRQTALDPHLLLDLEAPLPAETIAIGQRAIVRFDHGSEPIAFRLVRALRQLFLSQFDV